MLDKYNCLQIFPDCVIILSMKHYEIIDSGKGELREMKHRYFLTALFVFALLFALTACQTKESTKEGSITEVNPPEPTVPVPSESGDAPDFEVRRESGDIVVPFFSEDELDTAVDTVQAYLAGVSTEIGTLSYEVECIAYDPIMTDVHVRQKMAGAPVNGWTEEDYYTHQISFAVTYSAAYDHEKSPVQDVEHNTISVDLKRENPQSSWEFQGSGAPVEEYSGRAMSAAELANITDVNTRVLAGYETDDEYWLYLCDNNTDVFFKKTHDLQAVEKESNDSISTELSIPAAVWDESDYQKGVPASPQPGDTKDSWNPSLAEAYPPDRECSDMELLEKWMAVEGLTMKDLDERGCRQLVLVAAQETDGIQTCTSCYQKQTDGSWNSVDGLTQMRGWTGNNGIMHGRKRNSNTSPAGLWSLGLTFGNARKPMGLKMPWRDVTPNTDWVCDEESIYFNTWQERNDPTVTEFWGDDVEHLEDYSMAYAYACVIRFNTPPYTIPERGCAIFLHCAKAATGGCIGLPETDMVNTLLWLDPSQNPYILITGHQNG